MSLRILVVEQGLHAREGLRDILASDGHEVSVAADAAAGLARVTSQRFDLLLLDAEENIPGDLAERGVVAVLKKPVDVSWSRFELESLTSRRPPSA
ncbi:MAG: hypothetical protein DMD97_18815 [Candidatus Rokuibacteriota bacterium]|nr:MAG: hypothetical protein DMD97_18815 [Candidatus Rokubacteria bacterium]